MKPVKITYFVHGTTTDNENGISTGWNQGELSKLGIEQSKKLKGLIGKKKFDVGESCKDVEKRIRSFLDNLLKKYDGKHPPSIDFAYAIFVNKRDIIKLCQKESLNLYLEI